MTYKVLPNHATITHWSFWVIPLIATIVIRAILSIFKSWAIIQGEADKEDGEKFRGERKFCVALKQSFFSGSGHRNIDDHWLPFWIGLIEVYIYPVLMASGKWKEIGFWIGVKAASQLVSWHDEPSRSLSHSRQYSFIASSTSLSRSRKPLPPLAPTAR